MPVSYHPAFRPALAGALVASALLQAACMQQPPDDDTAKPAAAPTTAAATAVPAAPAVSSPPATAAAAAPADPELAAHMQTPAFRREYRDKMEQLNNEAKVNEEAPWLGTTGLTDEQERSLPRYVRMELGQSLADANALHARDLDYVGRFVEPDGTVYYWRLPAKAAANATAPQYAYMRQGPDGVFYTDWGSRVPPLR